MSKYVYIAAWGATTLAAAFAVAAHVDWHTLPGAFTGGAMISAAIAAALMHPPAFDSGSVKFQVSNG